jgi:hypothetical protein
MTIISYRPSDDQFWIACSKEEAEKWFVPLLNERGLRRYRDVLLTNEKRKQFDPEGEVRYNQIVKDAMDVDEVAYAYFNVSRDLSVCYSDVAHHPFHQLWNAYSPFYLCDHIVINTPDELKSIQPTYKGKSFEEILAE